MAYQVFFTDASLADLDEIMLRAEVEHPSTAERFGNSLLNHAGLLSEFPFLGAPIGGTRRRLLHFPFYIYYSVDESKRRIEVERFWHHRRIKR